MDFKLPGPPLASTIASYLQTMDKLDDIADQQHLARLATAFATKLTSPSPTATIPLKGVDPPEPPDSNLLSITAISLEGHLQVARSQIRNNR